MDRKVQLSLLLALCLHACVLFGIAPSPQPRSALEPEKPQMEVELVAAVIEEPPAPPPPPPPPEPPAVPPPAPEPPQEIPPLEPPPVSQQVVEAPVEPVKALITDQPIVAAPPEAEFQVAATRNVPESVPLDVPLSPPVAIVPTNLVVKGEPRYRRNPQPEYPLQAKRRRQEGQVLLSVLLETNGLPLTVEVIRSSGFTLLDNTAQDAIRGWEFEAATVNGQVVRSQVEVPVRFRLGK